MPKLLITPDLTLYRALRKVIEEYPERPAVTFGDRTLTYRELGEKIDVLARGLRSLGVGPDDKVAIILPNCLEMVYAFFAPSALGAVIVPLNPVYRQQEFAHILADSEATVVIAEPKPRGNDVQGILQALRPSLPGLRHLILRGEAAAGFIALADLEGDKEPLSPDAVSPDTLCALVYTSGTTGVPKAVMHSHRSMLSAVSQGEGRVKAIMHPLNLARMVRQYGLRLVRSGLKQTVMLSPTPMHVLLGYSQLLYGLLFGFRIVVAERFHPGKVLQLVEQQRVSLLTLAPTQLAALLNSRELEKYDYSSLIYIALGAAPVPPALLRRAREVFRCPVLIGFGATETGGGALVTMASDAEHLQAESVGRLFPGMEAKVVDDERRELPRGETGELAVRLGSTMLGYWKAPELTAQTIDKEGYYYTGDLATMDEAGYVRIVGRKKDMIIRGGQNVYPAEIEHHLMSKPGIQQVAVVGVPDPLAGESVWAFVVPQAGATITSEDVWSYCRGELAPFKVPSQVRIVESLPMTATEKVRKFVLREAAVKEIEAAGAGATAAQTMAAGTSAARPFSQPESEGETSS